MRRVQHEMGRGQRHGAVEPAARNTQYDRANAMMPDLFEKKKPRKKKPRKIKKIVSKLKKVRKQAELCLRVSHIKM